MEFEKGIVMLSHARSAVVLLCLLACSCSMPMTVRHIKDPEQSAEGVRYLLKRPSYKLVLVVDEDDLAKVIARGGCILAEDTFRAVLKQELSGDPELYEVGGPGLIGKIANLFADTNLTVTLDDSGHLVSVEGGAADKSLEFVQAVAGLAVSLAKKAVGPLPEAAPPEPPCFIEDQAQKEAIIDYAQRHLTLLQRREILRDTLDKGFAALPMSNTEPTSREKILQAIALLRTEQTHVQAALKEIGYAVPSNLYCLFFDDDPDPESDRWLRIDPKSGGEIDREGGGEFDPERKDVEDCPAAFRITLRRRA